MQLWAIRRVMIWPAFTGARERRAPEESRQSRASLALAKTCGGLKLSALHEIKKHVNETRDVIRKVGLKFEQGVYKGSWRIARLSERKAI